MSRWPSSAEARSRPKKGRLSRARSAVARPKPPEALMPRMNEMMTMPSSSAKTVRKWRWKYFWIQEIMGETGKTGAGRGAVSMAGCAAGGAGENPPRSFFPAVVAAAEIFFQPDVGADEKVTAAHLLDLELGDA